MLCAAPQEYSAELLRSVEDALAEKGGTPQQRLELVAQLDQRLATKPNKELWAKTRFIESVALFRSGKLDDATRKVRAFCEHKDTAAFPTLRFRGETLHAVIRFVRGEQDESVAIFKRILNGPDNRVPPDIRQRTQINYAGVLLETGRADAAIAVYEDLMLEATVAKDDVTTMHAGSNLIISLMNRDDELTAKRIYDKLQAVMKRNWRTPLADSILLSGIELTAGQGEPEAAIAELDAFLMMKPQPINELLLRVHGIKASLLLKSGKPRDAIRSAREGEKLAGGSSMMVGGLRLAAARAYVRLKDYQQALAEIETIDPKTLRKHARAVQLERVRLEAMLGLGGHEEAIEVFNRMLAAQERAEEIHSERNARYHQAHIDRVAAEHRADSEARHGQLVNTIVGISVIAGILALFLWNRWYIAQLRVRSEKQQRDQLESLVQEKTAKLERTLAERTEIEAALYQKKRLEAIGTLAGNVAHDFNNLLQVIGGAIQLALRSEVPEERKTASLAVAENSISHSARVIRNLMAYARQQELTPRVLKIRDYLDSNQSLVRSSVTRPNRFELENLCTGVLVSIDESQLTTSLLNLLNNADEATDYGVIRLIARQESIGGNYGVSLKWPDIRPGEYVLLLVEDTGCGMSAEQLERAMEPFFSTKTEKGGTGLGLSSVYGFARQSGGDFRIISELGVGTTAALLLPVADGELSAAEQKQLDGATCSIANSLALVVDDNQRVAETVRALLEELDLEVVSCESAREARQILQSADLRFDYVLTDVTMPGDMDGVELAEWIAQNYPDIMVALMTGYSDKAATTQLPALQKPFEIDELKNMLISIRRVARSKTQ